jgi:hypothetical protein
MSFSGNALSERPEVHISPVVPTSGSALSFLLLAKTAALQDISSVPG